MQYMSSCSTVQCCLYLSQSLRPPHCLLQLAALPGGGGVHPHWGVLGELYRSTGVQEYRCTGVQVYRCTGVLVYWCTGVQVYRCTGVQEYRCTGVQVYNSTGVHVYRCTGVQVYRCTGVHDLQENMYKVV